MTQSQLLPMLLWSHWWKIVSQLRPACSRQRSFLWLAVTLAAMGVRRDLGGVTSFVRALGLKPACYGYRAAIRRKLDAYHRHIQIGLVAQGLLQCLAATQSALIWQHFGSWLRTVRAPLCPSEFVVACALRNSLPDFLAASPQNTSFELFVRDRLDLTRIEGTCLAA